jgi:hypothetical protein
MSFRSISQDKKDGRTLVLALDALPGRRFVIGRWDHYSQCYGSIGFPEPAVSVQVDPIEFPDPNEARAQKSAA